ncbi:hypothetical protein [Sphingomonas sp. UNC305MFCol5.2]|uniref:hypothetical protein n=1 Tax=Sphingomonas sp. UNC305MFCol5.2 TaxID=1449076 RepID=UPI0004A77FED|nr:hypothetical protein [Sphingomonas sp. UNC305MFCol5.2]
MSQLFGGLLLGVGILVMTCSGLCSLVIVVMGAGMVFQEPSVLLLPLVVGGIPFAIGFGMFHWGKWLLRQANDRET